MIKIGFSQSNFFPSKHNHSVLDLGTGQIVFKGYANIGAGAKLSVDSNGQLVIGNQLWSTGPILIICRESIEIGDNCVFSWNITIMDHDAHSIIDERSQRVNENNKIVLGKKVWVGFNSSILKGSFISDNVVIGAGSLVVTNKKYISQSNTHDSNTILAGIPAKVIKRNIFWEG